MKRGTVVSCVARLDTFGDEAMVGRTPPWFAVVVGARRAFQKTESVSEEFETTERIRDPAPKPAQHPSAHARKDCASQPRLAKYVVEPVSSPEREEMRRVAASNIENVLARHKAAQIRGPLRLSRQQS